MIGDPGVNGVGDGFLAFFIASPMLLRAVKCPTLGLENDPPPVLVATTSLELDGTLETIYCGLADTV